MPDFDGLWWLIAGLFPLLFLQRRLHQELMAIFLILTRHEGVALALFSLVFFPGVVLHEMSHWVSAKLLGVRTGKIWLIPERLPDGNLRMGYVEAERVEFLREALIGFAPLLFGGLFVGYAGLFHLKFHLLWETLMQVDIGSILDSFVVLYQQNDFWLWFYLTFVVSATMMPSPSDRQAWLPLVLFITVLLGVALLAGAGPWLATNLVGGFNQMFRSAAVVFGISNLVHLLLLLPTTLFRMGLNRVTGLVVLPR